MPPRVGAPSQNRSELVVKPPTRLTVSAESGLLATSKLSVNGCGSAERCKQAIVERMMAAEITIAGETTGE